jgi:23S rRNA G2445 N2-methylase RlmL
VTRRRSAATPTRRARTGNGPAARPARLFAFSVPGLAPLLKRELQSVEGVQVQGAGFDGRSDVVTFTANPRAVRHLSELTLAEDIFVEVGRTLRSEGDRAPWIAGRLLKPERTKRALSTRSQILRPVRDRASYRVIVRVLQERSFLRTDLRRHLSNAVAKQQPLWNFHDPADLELWVVEYQQGKIIAGFRASDASMRQHDGRREERSGALRATVAAAMVRLAGDPAGTLLDPCCGSGTILNEATRAGWNEIYGADIAPDAIDVARYNAPGAHLSVGDARKINHPPGSVDACVSNLPFGQQYGVQDDMGHWLRDVLVEMIRVTRPDGRVVLLSPAIAPNLIPAELRLTDRLPIRLLGTKTTLWGFDRR